MHATNDRAAGAVAGRSPADVRRGLGAVHRLVRRHRPPGRCPPTRPPSSRSWPTARPRRRPSGAGSPPSTTTTPRPGIDRPGESAAVLAALGRPTGEPRQIPVDDRGRGGGGAARRCPVHGWTQGMFGRRDRCLLVLSQLAGVPYKHLATLTAGDVTVADGTATITSPAGDVDSSSGRRRPVLCGPCAVTRWLRVLDLVVTRPSHRDIAQALEEGRSRSTERSPHLCRSTRGSGRRDPGGAVAAADRPMGVRAVPAAAADPALVVPPRSGHAGR